MDGKTWTVEEYDGSCKHNVKIRVKEQGYGTRHCLMCGASQRDGVWRVLVKKEA